MTETIHKIEFCDLYHGIFVQNVYRTDEICGMHCLVYTYLLEIQSGTQLSSPICVDFLWSWQVQLYCFRHQLKFLRVNIPGLPKSGINSTNRLRVVIRWDDDGEFLQLSLCKDHRHASGRFSPFPECYYTCK